MSIFRNIRFLIVSALLIAVGVAKGEEKSFSQQMNEIKRSGEYIYAESSAADESDAKSACNELLKIEITKYLTENDSEGSGKIIKDISQYDCQYLSQPRGEMTRVFAYIAKSGISAAKEKSSSEKQTGSSDNTPKEISQAYDKVQQSEKNVSQPVQDNSKPVNQSTASVSLKSDGLDLAKWQLEMLESVVKEQQMAQAKKVLNRYKNQNRIKRLGDRSMANTRPDDTFYVIYNESGAPCALLAPSSTKQHYDMISGSTLNIDNYSGNQYYWFQISK